MTNHAVIAHRYTADNKRIELWSDGFVTAGFGGRVEGIGASRVPAMVVAFLAAGWWLMGDACLFDLDEIGHALKAARKLAVRTPGARPGDFRAAALRALAPPDVIHPQWTTLETDRDGRPRVQCWVLPRLVWPGLAVWRERGTYSLWREANGSGRSPTYFPTGVTFKNLRDLTAHLRSLEFA